MPGQSRLSSGHLSLFATSHDGEAPLRFDQRRHLAPAITGSVASHVALTLITLGIAQHVIRVLPDASVRPRPLNQIVWLHQAGPAGGGGGGGNRTKDPPRRVELPGNDSITVPVARPNHIEPTRQINEPNPIESLIVPTKSLADAVRELPGALDTIPAATTSQGSGSENGGGTGRNGGDGSGDGRGFGPGRLRAVGGEVYQPGDGVRGLRLVHQVRPKYTSDAMRARVQGVAVVQCIVRTNGTPTDCQIHRSLDPTFGLDQEAVRSAREWRFTPGVVGGERVNVQVLIEMAFALR